MNSKRAYSSGPNNWTSKCMHSCGQCGTSGHRVPRAGNLNFNDELLALDREVADYVIVTSCYISLFQITGSFGKA